MKIATSTAVLMYDNARAAGYSEATKPASAVTVSEDCPIILGNYWKT